VRRPALLRARIFAFALTVPLLMRLRLSPLEHLLEPRRRPANCPPERAADLAREVDLVLRRSRFVRSGCLTRGLTRYYFLRRAGLPVSLCFGIGRPGEDLEGHCWLIRDGRPYLEETDPREVFVETYRLPSGQHP
jgi:hypothetical protein